MPKSSVFIGHCGSCVNLAEGRAWLIASEGPTSSHLGVSRFCPEGETVAVGWSTCVFCLPAGDGQSSATQRDYVLSPVPHSSLAHLGVLVRDQ